MPEGQAPRNHGIYYQAWSQAWKQTNLHTVQRTWIPHYTCKKPSTHHSSYIRWIYPPLYTTSLQTELTPRTPAGTRSRNRQENLEASLEQQQSTPNHLRSPPSLHPTPASKAKKLASWSPTSKAEHQRSRTASPPDSSALESSPTTNPAKQPPLTKLKSRHPDRPSTATPRAASKLHQIPTTSSQANVERKETYNKDTPPMKPGHKGAPHRPRLPNPSSALQSAKAYEETKQVSYPPHLQPILSEHRSKKLALTHKRQNSESLGASNGHPHVAECNPSLINQPTTRRHKAPQSTPKRRLKNPKECNPANKKTPYKPLNLTLPKDNLEAHRRET
jgi:hypothetical protein